MTEEVDINVPTTICNQSIGVPPRLASVSVVIPAFNATEFLEEALKSVGAQIVPAYEAIVVDDGSTDGTARLAAALGARVIREGRRGPAAARNTGARAARGTWIAFLDADDVWEPWKIGSQLSAIVAFPDARMVSCDRRTVSLATGAVVEDSHLRSLGSGYSSLRSKRFEHWRYFAPSADGLVRSGFSCRSPQQCSSTGRLFSRSASSTELSSLSRTTSASRGSYGGFPSSLTRASLWRTGFTSATST